MDRLDRATLYLFLTMVLGAAYGFAGLVIALPAADWSGVMLAVAFGASPVVAAFLAGGQIHVLSLQAAPAVLLFLVHAYFLFRLPPGGGVREQRGVRILELVAGPVPAVMEELHAQGRH